MQPNTLHCTAVQHNTIEHNRHKRSRTVQYITVQYSTVQCSTVQYTIIEFWHTTGDTEMSILVLKTTQYRDNFKRCENRTLIKQAEWTYYSDTHFNTLSTYVCTYLALCICIAHALTAWICLKASLFKLHNMHFVLHLKLLKKDALSIKIHSFLLSSNQIKINEIEVNSLPHCRGSRCIIK